MTSRRRGAPSAAWNTASKREERPLGALLEARRVVRARLFEVGVELRLVRPRAVFHVEHGVVLAAVGRDGRRGRGPASATSRPEAAACPSTSWRMPSTSAAQLRRSPRLDPAREPLVRGAVAQRGDRRVVIRAPGAVRELQVVEQARVVVGRRARSSSPCGTRPRTRPRDARRPCGPRAAAASGQTAMRSSRKSIARVSTATSSGSIAGKSAMRSWLRPSLRYGSTSTIPFARSAARERGRVDPFVEVDRRGDRAAVRGVLHERRRELVAVGPAVDDRGRPVAAAGRELEPAVLEHPLQLLVEEVERRERGRVVRLVEARVLDRDRQVERRRHPARRAAIRSMRSIARGRAEREPQAAVAREALLRREVVHVERMSGRRACRPRPTCRRRRRARRRAGRCTSTVTPVDVSLCGYA